MDTYGHIKTYLHTQKTHIDTDLNTYGHIKTHTKTYLDTLRHKKHT